MHKPGEELAIHSKPRVRWAKDERSIPSHSGQLFSNQLDRHKHSEDAETQWLSNMFGTRSSESLYLQIFNVRLMNFSSAVLFLLIATGLYVATRNLRDVSLQPSLNSIR